MINLLDFQQEQLCHCVKAPLDYDCFSHDDDNDDDAVFDIAKFFGGYFFYQLVIKSIYCTI